MKGSQLRAQEEWKTSSFSSFFLKETMDHLKAPFDLIIWSKQKPGDRKPYLTVSKIIDLWMEGKESHVSELLVNLIEE